MSTIRTVAFFAFLLIFWGLLAHAQIWDKTLFPSPMDVLDYFKEGIQKQTLVHSTVATLRRVLIGYFVSMVLGVPLGIMLARVRLADETIGSVVSGLQALPSMCWLPIAVLWFGLNDSAILFVVVMGSLVSITVSVRDGVKNLPPIYVRAARTMGISRLQMVTKVLLPASLPALLTGSKLGWAYAWRALMAGELLFGTVGLGQELMKGRELADMAQVIGVMLVIVAIGLITDNLVFGSLERLVRDRFGLSKA